MKIQKINTGILITHTAKQPSAKIEFSLDELDALSEFCERLQDEKDVREYLNTAVAIPDSAEVSAPVAAKYLRDAALFEQLVDETRRNQEENQSDFLTAVSDAVSSIEKHRNVKEWHGLTKEIAERTAREFIAERNPGRWSGFGDVPESVSLDPLNFPINDIYPKGNKPALRMQLIGVTYPSLHRVCECSIIEDGVDLWARRTLDSMTAGTVEDLVETVLYVARMYERSKCFERIYVNRIQMEKSEYEALIRHLNDPDSINDEYQISNVVFAADNTIVSVLWEGNCKDGVSGMVTLTKNGKTVYATKSTKVFCNHWVIPYNGAEYHVLVDVLPKKTVLEETVHISEPYAERIEKYLRGAEVQGEGASLSKTAKFSNGLTKSGAGQFFTPYNVGQMMARINMPDSFVPDKSRILRVNDPCCGAGCLLLAGYNAMREQLESTDPDWDKYVLFVAQDIDPLVCKMCYIQMCCIGVPGVVVVGNSLFPDAERSPIDFWFTPKYFLLDDNALKNTYTEKE